jgi:hypothetical protein
MSLRKLVRAEAEVPSKSPTCFSDLKSRDCRRRMSQRDPLDIWHAMRMRLPVL